MKLLATLYILLFTCSLFSQGNGLYKFQDKNTQLYGFMNETGKIIIKPNYLITGDFSEGLCYVSNKTDRSDYKWIFIDTLANTVIDLHDDFVEGGFSQGYARISTDKGDCFIDKKGSLAFGRYFAETRSDFKEGIAMVSYEKFKALYFIDLNGDKVTCLPKNTALFQNGLAGFYNENGYGITDTKGNIIISGYENCDGYLKDYIKVQINSKWGFIDRKGKTIYNFIYNEDDIEYGNDSLFLIKKNDLWGITNVKGETVVVPKFKKLSAFSEGLAAASIDGEKWGFIDNKGNFVIEPDFYGADSFENGICAVKLNKEVFRIANDYFLDALINKEGKVISQLEMHSYMGFQGNLIEYYGGGHFSGGVYYANKKGEQIIPHE